MGREIRRVPPGWEHPKRPDGEYQPCHNRTVQEAQAEWDKGKAEWDKDPKENYIWKEWISERPEDGDPYYRPAFTTEPTCFQFYEDTTEGTPLSPVFEKIEDLKKWLVEEEGIPESAARFFCERGSVPSMVFVNGQFCYLFVWLCEKSGLIR